jgi:hypothetical protein
MKAKTAVIRLSTKSIGTAEKRLWPFPSEVSVHPHCRAPPVRFQHTQME